MPRKGYIIDNQQAIYYLTFTVAGWIDILHGNPTVISSLNLSNIVKQEKESVCFDLNKSYF